MPPLAPGEQPGPRAERLTCAWVAEARPGGPVFPAAGIEDSSRATGVGRWTARVLLQYGGGSAALDVVLERDAGGEWTVVEVRELSRGSA